MTWERRLAGGEDASHRPEWKAERTGRAKVLRQGPARSVAARPVWPPPSEGGQEAERGRADGAGPCDHGEDSAFAE